MLRAREVAKGRAESPAYFSVWQRHTEYETRCTCALKGQHK